MGSAHDGELTSEVIFIPGRSEEGGEGNAAHQAGTEWHDSSIAQGGKAREGTVQRARSSKARTHEPREGSVRRRRKTPSPHSSEEEEEEEDHDEPALSKRLRSHDDDHTAQDVAGGEKAGAGHAPGTRAGETPVHVIPGPVRFSSEPPRKRGRPGIVGYDCFAWYFHEHIIFVALELHYIGGGFSLICRQS